MTPRSAAHADSSAIASSSGIGTAVHPHLHQVGERLPHHRPGRQAQQLHHLVAVERRPQGIEVLLLRERGDPLLELVLQLAEARRLAFVARGARPRG